MWSQCLQQQLPLLSDVKKSLTVHLLWATNVQLLRQRTNIPGSWIHNELKAFSHLPQTQHCNLAQLNIPAEGVGN